MGTRYTHMQSQCVFPPYLQMVYRFSGGNSSIIRRIEMLPPTLSLKHHTLIQALLSRGPLKESDFRSIFHKVTGKSPYHPAFNQYILNINDALDCVQLELRKCLDQYDGKAYYGVVNSVSDEHSKLGTKYSVPQIAFYKRIIEAIVQDTAGEGSISNIDALNIRWRTSDGRCSWLLS